MIVGVNGSGKTTTVGKLCHLFADQGQHVVVAASDTYRDAAAEQLGIWAKRAGVEIVSSVQGQDAARSRSTRSRSGPEEHRCRAG